MIDIVGTTGRCYSIGDSVKIMPHEHCIKRLPYRVGITFGLVQRSQAS